MDRGLWGIFPCRPRWELAVVMYRGRLIWAFQARIERLDTAATDANAIGGQAAGYDRIFREPVTNTAGVGARIYSSPIAVTCQVRSKKFDEVVTLPGGRELEFDLRTLLHYEELEAAGLIGADGSTVFKPSDRLMSIYKTDGVSLRRDFSANPLFCVHVQDRGWGLSGLDRNLVRLYWKDRREGHSP